MKSLNVMSTFALFVVLTNPAHGQTPPAEEMPTAAPMGESPPMSKLPGAVSEPPVPPDPPKPPLAEPVQAVSAPPPAPQAIYPPCTASLQDQCTNSARSAVRASKRKPRSR